MTDTQTLKRWPVIRHVRYAYLSWQFRRWWNAIGCHLGAVPNEADLQYLEQVRTGTDTAP